MHELDIQFFNRGLKIKKGNIMNSEDRLECLRLAVETTKIAPVDILVTAKRYYAWVSETDKPNSLNFEKISPERNKS
jgi:hypothetical protein